MKTMTTILGFAVLAITLSTAPHAAEAQYENILALKPVGFWPADEGSGTRLRDLGSMGNDANLFNTTWANSALNFTGGYEFVEIPRNPATLSDEFSLGTWVFMRRPRDGRKTKSRGTTILGNWARHWSKLPGPIALRLTGENKLTIEVVSNRKPDVLGSVAAGVRIESETWQHVFYTYKDGEGRLFVNGKPVCSKEDVPYTPQPGEYIAGADSQWWTLYPPRSEALDGSLQGIVIFDRAIGDAEVASLVNAVKPSAQPHVIADDELRLHGRFIKLMNLGALSLEDQRLAIRFMHLPRYGWTGNLEANKDVLKPYLSQALQQPLLRYDAALLLEKLKGKQTLANAKSQLLARVADTNASRKDRATAALVLGRIGAGARNAVATLTTLLRENVATGGVHVPRVEDLFRNALVTALLAIDGSNADVRKLLGNAYAKPILDTMDMAQPYMEPVKKMVDQGLFMDALDACKPIIKEQKLYFRSQNDPDRDQRDHWAGNSRAYTAVATYKGCTYTMGNGKAFDGCSPITQADYDRALSVHSKDHPHAAKWLDGNVAGMFRADLKKTVPDGTVQTVYIGGENFIFSGRDAKTKAWSITLDKHGYIHVMGGQHNYPRNSEFMPGAWESLGLSGDRKAPNHPTTLYWISKRPEDVTEFEFVGRKGHPQDLPVPFMNYMNFVQDRNQELYLYGRNDSGIQNWAFYRYDVDARKWHDLGAERSTIVASARKADSEWVQSIERTWFYCFRGYLPDGTSPIKGEGECPSLSWTWQPFFYNYIRATRGIQFDPENRIYIEIPTYGYDAERRVREANLFVYSDDGAKTFHRADGSSVKLPLTSNPAPEHNADVLRGYNEIWFKQWSQLIRRIGFIF
jgi:hypothetical protein